LNYFFTAWPQPSDYLSVMQKSFRELDPADAPKVVKALLPEPLVEELSAGGMMAMIEAYYDKIRQERIAREQGAAKQKAEPDIIDQPLAPILDKHSFSVRIQNACRKHGITSLRALSNLTDFDILNMKNVGAVSFDKIAKLLAEYNLTLRVP
jgi:hypothetical protein